MHLVDFCAQAVHMAWFPNRIFKDDETNGSYHTALAFLVEWVSPFLLAGHGSDGYTFLDTKKGKRVLLACTSFQFSTASTTKA